MKEKDIENYLRTQVKKLGGIAYKFISPGNVGVPDRIIIMPNGKIYFVELKTDKGKLTELQNRQINIIKNLFAFNGVIRFVFLFYYFNYKVSNEINLTSFAIGLLLQTTYNVFPDIKNNKAPHCGALLF